jgi:hypothetical protein
MPSAAAIKKVFVEVVVIGILPTMTFEQITNMIIPAIQPAFGYSCAP